MRISEGIKVSAFTLVVLAGGAKLAIETDAAQQRVPREQREAVMTEPYMVNYQRTARYGENKT